MDKVSLDRILLLHPKLRKDATDVLKWAWDKGIRLRYTQTLRTFKEQQDLYDKGRTIESRKKGEKIVTRARPGQSYHNYGLALDIALISVDGKDLVWDLKYDGPDEGIKADWMEVVEQFKARGWTWGGNFKSLTDNPHFERTFGKTYDQLSKLKSLKKVDKEGYVLVS